MSNVRKYYWYQAESGNVFFGTLEGEATAKGSNGSMLRFRECELDGELRQGGVDFRVRQNVLSRNIIPASEIVVPSLEETNKILSDLGLDELAVQIGSKEAAAEAEPVQ